MTDKTDLKQRIDNANITDEVKESLRLIEDLNFFLATAPANWQKNQVIRRYYLKNDEGFISCIFWNNLYFITGTDIVRCIAYKFHHFGREIIDRKKFEEGIFSDLRNLKNGTDAILEPPKSEFLNFLYKNNCLRTQKKQKVFFWFNVPHEKLMKDALERDTKKERAHQMPTTKASKEPSLSFEFGEERLLCNYLIDRENNKFYSSNDTTDADTTSTTNNSNAAQDEPKKTKKTPKLDSHLSPEYTTTTISKASDYAFLNQETPEIYKHQSDDEDFPLDYFEESSNDYILIDPSLTVNPPQFIDDIGDHVTYPVTQVVANDEFLIEQTLPIKTPIPVPFSAKYPTSSNPDEYYNFPPISGRLQTFPRSATDAQPFTFAASTPTQSHATPIAAHASAMVWPHSEMFSYADPVMNPIMVMNEYNEPMYHVMSPYPYTLPPVNPPVTLQEPPERDNRPRADSDKPKDIPSLTGPPTATQTITLPANFHGPLSSPYGTAFGLHPHPFLASPVPVASQRQQSISANMMKKKHQMLKGVPGPLVHLLHHTNPNDVLHHTNPEHRVHKPKRPLLKPDDIIASQVDKSYDKNEVLISTPDSMSKKSL